MRSERERVASEIRAQGTADATIIRANAKKVKRVLLAEAEEEAKRVKGDGDSKAIKIYAESYNKAPKFFEFYRTIEAYKNSFSSKDDVLVLKPEGEFFKYFNDAVK